MRIVSRASRTPDQSELAWCWALFFFQAEDGIRDYKVTGVQTCALPICAFGACLRPLRIGHWFENGVEPDLLQVVRHDHRRPAKQLGVYWPGRQLDGRALRADRKSVV